ncbi:MAG TPA: WD40 domain-containing protein [Gemmataceae bacterium]|jgi:WD40 repeat protein
MLTPIGSPWLRSPVSLIAIALAMAALPSTLCCAEPADAEAEAALKRFADRLVQPSGDRAKLREEILDFRLKYPGTPLAARASGLLSQLRSPLDKLDPANIPPLERFPSWQPKELVGVVGEHRGRHAAPVSCAAFSSDGTMAASGGGSYVRLWDAATLRLHSLVGHYAVTSLAFSKDSKALVVGGAGGAVTVWDITKEKQLQLRFTVQACTSAVYGVAFSPDNKSIAAGCFDNAIRLYDVSGKKIEETATLNDHKQAVSTVAYSPDGKTLASGSYDKTIHLWDMRGRDSQSRAVLEGHVATVTALAYTAKGSLASADSGGNVLLWGVPSGSKPKPRVAFTPKAGSIAALSFSATGATLALACADGTARLWNVSGAPRERFKLEGHASAVSGVAYAPDNKTLVTGSSDWTVRSWDLTAARPKERFMPWSHLSVTYAIDFSLDLTTLVSGSEDRILRLWDLTKPDLKTRAYLKSEDKVPIYQAAYSPDGKSVAAGGLGLNVRQWDAHTPIRTRPTLKTPGYVNQLLYSPDSRYILTRSQKTVILWDARTSGEVRRFPTEDMDIHCAAWSPDGKYILTGHGVYLMENGKHVYKNGVPLYTDCIVRMFDVEKGEEIYRDKSFTAPIYSEGFSVDGRQAFTGLNEPALRRWEASPTGLKPAVGWKGSSGYVQFMRFSPDGKQVVTYGLDGQVVLWDLSNGKRVKAWPMQENVANVAYASDSRHLAVSLSTGVVYILRLATVEDSR